MSETMGEKPSANGTEEQASKPRDLFFAIDSIWDRANPVEGEYGMYAERRIATFNINGVPAFNTNGIPAEEARVLGRQFTVDVDLLRACTEAADVLEAMADKRTHTDHALAVKLSATAVKLRSAIARAEG